MESDEVTSSVQMLRYLVLVPTITLYYDHILTFAKEVEWIWRRKLTVPTTIFLFLRYSTTFWDVLFICGLFGVRSTFFTCTLMIKAPMIYVSVHTACVEAILMLRTYALYRCNKTVFFTLSTYILIQFVSTVIITLRITIADESMPIDNSSVTVKIPVCKANMHGDRITLFWWFGLGFDTLVFTLTYLETNRLRKWITSKNSPLLKLLTRDGLIFYVVICFLNLLNVWCYFFLEPELRVLGISFSMNLSTTMISRLVLNIQDVSQQMIGRFSQRPTAEASQDSTTDSLALTTAPSVIIESRILMAWDSFHDLHRVNMNQGWDHLPP